MRSTVGTAIVQIGLAVGAAVAFANQAAADVLIVSSTAPLLKPGQQLADSETLVVPAGANIRVMLPSGATLQIKGATSRQVKEITKGEPIVDVVWSKAKELLVTGGVDQSRVGATRSFRAPAAVADTFSWTTVGPTAAGNVCIDNSGSLAIERPAGAPNEVTLIDTGKNARAKLDFSAGAAVPWPQSIVASDGGNYQMTYGTAGLRQFKLRMVDKAATADGVALRTLLQNDCKAQAKTWAKN